MATTYTTYAKIKSLLQRYSDFDGTSTPNNDEVDVIINRAEDVIDTRTGHAWRTKTVTDEYHSPETYYDYRIGARVKLLHRKVKSFTTGDKLEVWDGNSWIDYRTSKTEGRNADYWINYDEGVIYIKNNYLFKEGIRVTYRYGEASVNLLVEDIATKMAVIDILSMYEQTLVMPDDGATNKLNYQNKIDLMQKQIDKNFELIAEYVCVV